MDGARRRGAWIAAALLHAGLLALLAQVDRPRRAAGDAIEIEVTEAEEPEVEAPASAPDEAADTADDDEAPRAAAPRRAARRAEVPASASEPEPGGGGAAGETADSGLALGWTMGSVLEGGGGGGGRGGAGGAGQGRGGRTAHRAAAQVPAPRRASRARPPRLVYPKRFRDERDGEVFVALLTIDEDGWVVGVRLVQGVNPHADEKALEAVWRFHYEPALDRAGRPVRARVKQPFMVE